MKERQRGAETGVNKIYHRTAARVAKIVLSGQTVSSTTITELETLGLLNDDIVTDENGNNVEVRAMDYTIIPRGGPGLNTGTIYFKGDEVYGIRRVRFDYERASQSGKYIKTRIITTGKRVAPKTP